MLGFGEPGGDVCPGLDALLFEPVGVGLDEFGFGVEGFVGSVDEVVERQVGFWAGGVEDAGGLVLGAVEEEGGEVASIDKADGGLAGFGDHE